LNRDELIRRLTATFLEELAEHVRVFNAELLLLEQDPPPARYAEAIHALFRAAHSLKGAARAVSATGIEGVAHKLEDLLARIRDGRRALTPELFQVLFAAADGFESAGKRFAEGGTTDLGLRPLALRLDDALTEPDSVARDPAPVAIGRLPPQAAPSNELGASVVVGELTAEYSASPIATAAQAGFVRISRARLDGLLRQGSELLITRRRFEARREELSAVQEHLSRIRVEWQTGGRALRRVEKRRFREIEVAPQAPSELPKRLARLLTHTDDELGRLTRAVDGLSAALREDKKALDRVAAPLEEQIHQLRLLPFAQACEGLSRAVRDLSNAQRKQIELRFEGDETEVDRAIVEGLREPLLHLVRNAIDHGIESPEARSSAGKSARARLSIAALVIGDSLEVSVSDDGRGLDFAAVQQRLRERGLEAEGAALEPERAIFLPGFSTANAVSDVSGRGVGLDVVKTAVERMNGSVAVTTGSSGTRFVLTLPLTLSTVRVLFLRVGTCVMALPSAAVEVLLRVEPAALKYVADKALIAHRGAPIPLASLARLLSVPDSPREQGAPLQAAVLFVEGRRVALIVDEFISEQDVVLKPLGPRMQDLTFVDRATLLSTGDIALVLRPQALLAAALDLPAFDPGRVASEREPKKRLLLADDSLTTRALERSILEAAGYDVVVAVDGQSAWQLLQERGADLVLSDVEMPKMDGLALTQTIRSSTRFRDLPVVLLTARDSQEDRARGLEAGANAYLVKSSFDQRNLLQTIEQLL
jgi:two-component system, chemotaxis family, sensor kinase CheA